MRTGLRRRAALALAPLIVLAATSPAAADVGLTLGFGGGYVGYFVPSEGSGKIYNGFGAGLDLDLVLSPHIVIAFYGEVSRHSLPAIGSQKRTLIGAYVDARFRVNFLAKRFVPYLAAGGGAWTSFLLLGDKDSSGTMGDRTAIALNIPLALGFEVRVHKYFSLGIEGTYHLLFGQGISFADPNLGERSGFDVWSAFFRIKIHLGVPDNDKLYGTKEEEEEPSFKIKPAPTPTTSSPGPAPRPEEPPPPDDGGGTPEPPPEDDTPPESGPGPSPSEGGE